jgi:hypothetical protein
LEQPLLLHGFERLYSRCARARAPSPSSRERVAVASCPAAGARLFARRECEPPSVPLWRHIDSEKPFGAAVTSSQARVRPAFTCGQYLRAGGELGGPKGRSKFVAWQPGYEAPKQSYHYQPLKVASRSFSHASASPESRDCGKVSQRNF